MEDIRLITRVVNLLNRLKNCQELSLEIKSEETKENLKTLGEMVAQLRDFQLRFTENFQKNKEESEKMINEINELEKRINDGKNAAVKESGRLTKDLESQKKINEELFLKLEVEKQKNVALKNEKATHPDVAPNSQEPSVSTNNGMAVSPSFVCEEIPGQGQLVSEDKPNAGNAAAKCSRTVERTVKRGRKRLPFGCDQCSKSFSSRENLAAHQKYVHRLRGLFLCDICGRKFNRKHHFEGHYNNLHRKIRRFNCKICKRGFYWEHALKKHVCDTNYKKKA